jgi:hypothetical protein
LTSLLLDHVWKTGAAKYSILRTGQLLVTQTADITSNRGQ